MVPGHCYLGFQLDAEGKEFAALETTLLGSAPEGEAVAIDGIGDVPEAWGTRNSWKSFTAALAIGTADLAKNAEKFKKHDDPDYQIISIAAARKLLAEAGFRVLLWDRPNCGASDLHFEGPSESAMQASFLVKLIRALDLGPTVLVSGSAGARISLFAAREDPSAIAGLMLCWISGGLVSMMRLGSYYCCEPAEEAALKGMEAVAAMPIWMQQVAANPRNRDYMLNFDRARFVAQMERWAAGYIPSPDTPVGGISKADFARLTMPARILRGSPDDLYHPAYVCEAVTELMPNARARSWSTSTLTTLAGSFQS